MAHESKTFIFFKIQRPLKREVVININDIKMDTKSFHAFKTILHYYINLPVRVEISLTSLTCVPNKSSTS